MRLARVATLLATLGVFLLLAGWLLFPRYVSRTRKASPAASDVTPFVDPGPRAPVEAKVPAISVLAVGGGGAPMGGAVVVAVPNDQPPYGQPPHRASVVTDTHGRATIDVPATWPASEWITVGASTADGTNASLPARARTGDEVRLVLEPAHAIRGRVTGCAPQEFPEVRVRAYCESWPEAPFNIRLAVVDAEGRFVIAGVRGFVGLTATAPGRAPSLRWTTQITESHDGVELALGPSTREVEVILVDSAREALPAGTPVRYRTGERSHVAAYLDARGAVALSYVAGDVLEICPDPVRDPAGGWRSAQWRFDVPASEVRDGLVLTVPRPPSVRFRLQDAKGQPICGLPVRMKTRTDERTTTFAGVTDAHGDWEPIAKSPHFVGGKDAALLVGNEAVWQGDLPTGALETLVVTLRGTWTVVQVTLVDWAGTPISSPNISIAPVDATYRGIESVSDVSRGMGNPTYAFDTPVVRVPIRDGILGSGHLSVLELGHRERLIPVRAEGVTVMPSPDTGAVRVQGWEGKGWLAVARRDDPGVRIDLRAGTAYGIAPGEYVWEFLRDARSSKRGTVLVQPGAIAEIDVR